MLSAGSTPPGGGRERMPMTPEVRFITQLSVAASNCSLYSEEHSMTKQSIARALEALEALNADRLEIMLVEGDLILNKDACREAGLHGKSMIRRLERRGISRVDFFKGVSAAEVQTFLSTLLQQSAAIASTPGIKVGAISVRTVRGEDDPGGGTLLQGLEESGIDRLKEIYSSISPFKRLEVVGLEEIIAGFVLALKQEANILKMISPVKSYSEYTYTHAANVALLSLCQAESLGVEERLLHDVAHSIVVRLLGQTSPFSDTPDIE